MDLGSTQASVLNDSTSVIFEPATFQRAVAKLLEVGECPVCYNDMVTPIFQCNNGHAMCSSCRPKLRCCPVCKARLFNVRNLSLEKVVNELPRRCRNSAHGCPLQLNHADRERHERVCMFRSYRCMSYLQPCQHWGPVSEAADHLRKCHNLEDSLTHFYFAVTPFGQTTSRSETWLEPPEANLLFRCIILFMDGRFSFLVHLVGTADDAQDYTVRIDVSHSPTKRRLRYEGPVLPVTTTVRTTTQTGGCLLISKPYLASFCDCVKKSECFYVQWHVFKKESQ